MEDFKLTAQANTVLMIDARNLLEKERVPFVFCVGTAQTTSLWKDFASQWGRRVLLFQAIGLGPHFPATKHCYPDISLRFQVQELLAAIENAFGDENVDLGGFSLGGRIALAAACERSFRKLHITGVALERSTLGLDEIHSWKDWLEARDMNGFAKAALSVSFAKQPNSDKLALMVDSLARSHRPHGILRLLEEAHDEEGPYSVKGIAKRLPHSQGVLVVGACDKVLAPEELVKALSRELGWPCVEVVPDSGHLVPFEASRAWRQHLTRFLDDTLK